jgi:hypothetical protein
MGRGEDRNTTDGPSETGRVATLLVSCTSCGNLHRTEHALDFSPVCTPCTEAHSAV